MFILTTISDLVQIPPHEFYVPSREEVENKINEKYSNKVLQKIGLCICMYDLLEHSEGLIGHSDGFVNVNVVFRLLVFRPFKSSILLARISSTSPTEGIKLSTEFFTDIIVPPHLLFPNTTYNAEENVFVWRNEDTDLYFDVGETVRFRVEAEEWWDERPRGPKSQPIREDGEAGEGETNSEKKAPYSIVGSMCEASLGPIAWW